LIPGYDPIATAGDCWFDWESAQNAIDFIQECLIHVKGELAGQLLKLEPWQEAIIANLFGWKRKDGTRRYREAFIFVPRKNGKSLLIATIINLVFFLDNEPGAELYTAAAEREQARLVFEMAKEQIAREPELSARANIQKYSITLRKNPTTSIKAISADAHTKHGFNTQLAVVDEVHAQPNRDLIDVLRTSMGARRQPLLVLITTSDFERESICNELHEYASKVRDGIIDDYAFLPVIYEASRDDDWTSPEVWRKANPNLGVSITEEFLQSECNRAKEEPAFENTFKRLYLNIRTEQDVRMIPMDQWDACDHEIDESELIGKPCWAGMDLATVNDLAALVLVFKVEDDYVLKPFFWCSKEQAEKRQKNRVPYLEWGRRGLIEITDTLRSIDFRQIRHRINELSKDYKIQEIAYDPYNATNLASELGAEDGFTMVEFRQGFLSMNEPTKNFLRLLADGKLSHGGHPVLRWMASNCSAKIDASGNIKPDKSASNEKIDGIVAAIMGIGRAMVGSETTSIYETEEAFFV